MNIPIDVFLVTMRMTDLLFANYCFAVSCNLII